MKRAALLLAVVTLASPASAHTLSYEKARKAAQRKADAFALQRTEVNVLMRRSKHRFYAQARWTEIRETPCRGCGYDPATGQTYDTTIESTVYCSVEMALRFRSRTSSKVRARIAGHTCF